MRLSNKKKEIVLSGRRVAQVNINNYLNTSLSESVDSLKALYNEVKTPIDEQTQINIIKAAVNFPILGAEKSPYFEQIKLVFTSSYDKIFNIKSIGFYVDWFFDGLICGGNIQYVPQQYMQKTIEYCIDLLLRGYATATTYIELIIKGIGKYNISIDEKHRDILSNLAVRNFNVQLLMEPFVKQLLGNPQEILNRFTVLYKANEITKYEFLKLIYVFRDKIDVIKAIDVIDIGASSSDHLPLTSNLLHDLFNSNSPEYSNYLYEILKKYGPTKLLKIFNGSGGQFTMQGELSKMLLDVFLRYFLEKPITGGDIFAIKDTNFGKMNSMALYYHIRSKNGNYDAVVKFFMDHIESYTINEFSNFLFLLTMPDEKILPIFSDVYKKYKKQIPQMRHAEKRLERLMDLLFKADNKDDIEEFISQEIPALFNNKLPAETLDRLWKLLKEYGWSEYYTDEVSFDAMIKTETGDEKITDVLTSSQSPNLTGIENLLMKWLDGKVTIDIELIKSKLLQALTVSGVNTVNQVNNVLDTIQTITHSGNEYITEDYYKQALKTVIENFDKYIPLIRYAEGFISRFSDNELLTGDFFIKVITCMAIPYAGGSFYDRMDDVLKMIENMYHNFSIKTKFDWNKLYETFKMIPDFHNGQFGQKVLYYAQKDLLPISQEELQSIVDKTYMNFDSNMFTHKINDGDWEDTISLDAGKYNISVNRKDVLDNVFYRNESNAYALLKRLNTFELTSAASAKEIQMFEAEANAVKSSSIKILEDMPHYANELEDDQAQRQWPLILSSALNYQPSDDRITWNLKNTLVNKVPELLKQNNLPFNYTSDLNTDNTKKKILDKEILATEDVILKKGEIDPINALSELMGGKQTGGEKKFRIIYNAQLKNSTSLHDIVVSLQNNNFQKAIRDKQYGNMVLSYVIRRADYQNFDNLIVAASKLPLFYSEKKKEIDANLRKQMEDGEVVIKSYKELKNKINEELKLVQLPTINELINISVGDKRDVGNLAQYKNIMYKYSEGSNKNSINEYVERLSRDPNFGNLETAIIKPMQKVYEVNGRKYRTEILRKDDPLGLVLGERLLTGCCQKFTGMGQEAMERGFLRPDHAFAVLYREGDDIPVSQGVLYYHVQDSGEGITVNATEHPKLAQLEAGKEYYFNDEKFGENTLLGWYLLTKTNGEIKLSKEEDRYLLFDSIEFHDMFVKNALVATNNLFVNSWLYLYRKQFNIKQNIGEQKISDKDEMKKQKEEIEETWKAFAKDLRDIYRTKMVSMGTGYTDFNIENLPETPENRYNDGGYSDADYSTDSKQTVRLALSNRNRIKLSSHKG